MQFLKRFITLGRDDLYERAMELFNNHQYKEAIEKFDELLKKKPSSTSLHHNLSRVYCGQAHRNLGIVLFTMGDYSNALQKFQKALQFNLGDIELYHFIGICLNNLGNFEGAMKAFNVILEVEPSHLSTKLKLGIAFHNLKMWYKAEQLYKDILLTNPDYADVHFHLGLALLGQKKIVDATQAFQNALTINPQYVEARKKLGIGQAYLGNYHDAYINLKAIIEKYPDFADIHYYLGVVHAGRNESSEAIECFNRCLRINPSFIDAKIKLGILYCRTGDFRAGARELEEASRLDEGNKNLAMAINVLKTLISTSSPQSTEEFFAILSSFTGDDPPIIQALEEFNRHIEITPDFSDMISIIKSFKDEDTSLCEMLIPFIREYISQHPTYPDLHNSLGILYRKLNKLAEAEACFKEAIRINPEFIKARLNLFATLKDRGVFLEAVAEGKLIASKNVLFPDFYCALGDIYFSLALYQEALECSQKSLSLNASYAPAFFLSGEIYEKQGTTSEAIKALQHCLKANPSKELYIKAREALNKLQG